MDSRRPGPLRALIRIWELDEIVEEFDTYLTEEGTVYYWLGKPNENTDPNSIPNESPPIRYRQVTHGNNCFDNGVYQIDMWTARPKPVCHITETMVIDYFVEDDFPLDKETLITMYEDFVALHVNI